MYVRLLLALLALTLAVPSPAEEVRRRVGGLTIVADLAEAAPGGLVVVRLNSRWAAGGTTALLDGRRFPFHPSRRGPRALVPVGVDATPGPATLGIEIRVRRGKQRVAVPITIAPRSFPSRTVVIPEERRALLEDPGAVRDGRLLLQQLRVVTPSQRWSGPFREPVAVAALDTFGAAQTWLGGSPVESLLDSIHGEYHRGLDYEVGHGIPVLCAAAGTVVLAGPLTLTGNTVVVDHGQGVTSVFEHLGPLSVTAGRDLQPGEPLGVSGDSGIAPSPHVHWGVYVGGIAVDPRVFLRGVD